MLDVPRVRMQVVHLRMPWELYERLKERARKEDRSVAYVIRHAIEQYLRKERR